MSSPDPTRSRSLLIGKDLGIAPMIRLAETVRDPIVLLGSTGTFPFRSRPSTILVPGIPDGVIASAPMLDEWGIPSRLASATGAPGCFEGPVVELASIWLRSLDQSAIQELEIFASGSREMIEAVNEIASELSIPCQIVQTAHS
jgi:dihydroorotate dehydrogenase electron transfer subunit